MPEANVLPSVSYEEIRCVEKPEGINQLNEAGYLAANPDLRKAGVSAREHFAQHGQREGRVQWINLDEVAALRERKLARLKFNRPPTQPRLPGEAMNFLSAQTIAEFGIPDAPPVSQNQYSSVFTDDVRASPDKLYLDVGAGLRHSVCSNVINTEIYPSISTDILCVGEDLPFADDQFDFVICAAVLEHTRRPWEVAREICRVLKPGGTVMVDYPFLQGVHGYPHHYFNATPQGAISLFEDECDIRSSTIEPNNHPMHSIWWVLWAWRLGLAGVDRERFESMTVGDILSRPARAHLDENYCRNLTEEMQRIIPAGSTLVAVKKQAAPTANRPARGDARAPAPVAASSTLNRLSRRLRRIVSFGPARFR
jgi:SAM-dependent methyltransferase